MVTIFGNTKQMDFCRLTSEQSNSILQNTSDFVSEHKFCTNWIDVEYQGWKLSVVDSIKKDTLQSK